MEPSVVHQTNDFLIIDKPAGIVVHPARTTRQKRLPVGLAGVVQSGGRGAGATNNTVTAWLTKRFPEVRTVGDDPKLRPGIVHRLDKDTSGVMVVARNQQAFEDLKQLFKERRVEKTYLALVVGVPKKKSGVIDAPIGRLMTHRTKRGIGPKVNGSRQATTEYRRLERLGEFSLLAVKPRTGRMHQIRVHLASIGTPVAGDRTYGGDRIALPGLERQFLHAWRLAFSYPEGRRWQFEAGLPPDMALILTRLRKLRKAA
ncbi:MAG: RluA family pseudouridine synthase [bacterium]|nr:RluA family pseudouridine synthase [bacterium]